MKKLVKITALIMSVLLILSLAGCVGGTGTAVEKLTIPGEGDGNSSEVSEVKLTAESDVEDSLDGLSEYLEGNYSVAGAKTIMSFDVIGAVNGYKYAFTYNSKNVSVEIYEFDLNDLNEEASACLESVKKDGKFQVLDKEVNAIISKSGKYIMIYTDEATEEPNKELKEKTEELFLNFKS